MKKLNGVRICLMSILLMLLVSGSALAYDSLKMYNETGRTIVAVYLFPAYSSACGPDRLSEVWNHGNSLTIPVPTKRYWDLRIRFDNGDSREWSGSGHHIDTVNVYNLKIAPSGGGRYTLYYNI